MNTDRSRCEWARTPLGIAYHDLEWGVPVHEDRTLFEFLILEGAQAGLSWETILKKRDAYREAFDGFDPARVARFTPARVERLLRNPGIIRNRLKIESSIRNAGAFLAVQKEFGSFDAYVWRFVGGAPRVNGWRTLKDIPPRTPESDALSKDLLRRDFKFVGSTICYAFMEAVGLVNDHTGRLLSLSRTTHTLIQPLRELRGFVPSCSNAVGACSVTAKNADEAHHLIATIPGLHPDRPRGQSSNVIAAPLAEKVTPRATRVVGGPSPSTRLIRPAGACFTASQIQS